METSLENALNGVEQPETVETPEVESQPEVKTEGPVRDESGRFAPKTQEKGVETPAQPQMAEQEAVPPTDQGLPKEEYTALRAIRDENKELKQQIAAMQQQYARQQIQPQAPEQAPVDFWDDPTTAIASQAKQAAQLAIREFQQEQVMQRIDTSETAAKARYADYGDAFGHFQQAVQVNPGLIAQMQAATDPAEFAYKTGKRAMELEQVGSLDDLIARERTKWEEEARAAIPPPTQTLPRTTATDKSVGARTGPTWSGPTPLGAALRQ